MFLVSSHQLLLDVKPDSKRFSEIAQIIIKGCLNNTKKHLDVGGGTSNVVQIKRCKLVNNVRLTKAVYVEMTLFMKTD